MPPYAKYMKDIVTNKRKIPSEEISTLLANYSFDGKVPKNLGDPGIPTIPCSILYLLIGGTKEASTLILETSKYVPSDQR
jgi:hypothetical protein